MSAKEATARIKINKFLDALGDKFEKTTRGYIEAEQALVAANRELIARFEEKIQATLARVWGEENQTATGV